VSTAEQDPNRLPGINAEETQSRIDGDGPQSRSATSGPGSRGSSPVAGNNVSGNTTGRGDVVGGNKSGHNINFGGIAVIVGVLIGVFFAGKAIVQSASPPSPSSITQKSSCDDYSKIEDPSARVAIINRIAVEIQHQGIIGSPFVLSEVDAACTASSGRTLGSVVKSARGY
jgi:hypothetical protein